VELFRNETAQALVLLSTRLTGLFFVAPVYSSRAVSMPVRTALLLVFSLLLLPGVPVTGGGEGVIQASPGTLLTEGILGLVLGLGAAIFVAAAESAGDMLAVQMGLSGANVLDPSSGTQMPVIGQFLGLFVLALILGTGGHLVMIQTLGLSLDAFPLGSSLNVEAGIPATVGMLGSQFLLGLRFAAPVVAAMMIGNAALGVMAKTVPQLNVLMMAFPLQIAIGLFTLGLSLPLITGFFSQWPDHYTDLASGVLESFLLPEGGS
jgi:flagellar biosynthetic protein FliR